MPHIVVEYSHELEHLAPHIISAVHASLGAEDSVDIARIKTRAVKLDDYIVGRGDKKMIHVTLKIMPRDMEVKKRMAQNIQRSVLKHAPDAAVTVETVILDPDTYCP
jgi:5-carboxymethyl-2-hydroxymuconate isomerase